MTGDFAFLKGNIEPIILNSLYNGDKYGYEIAREIKEKTENNYEIKQPTLYSYLKRLESHELITSYWGAESNGGRRRYYALTDIGKRNFEQYYTQWQHQRNIMDSLVNSDNAVDDNTDINSSLLLGTKRKSTRKKTITVKDIADQNTIAEKLALLQSEGNKDTDTTTVTNIISSQDMPKEVIAKTNKEKSPTNDREKFNIQHDTTGFMQGFEQLANEYITVDTSSSDDYKDVLMNIVGSQLDDMDAYSNNQQDIGAPNARQYSYSAERALALEDVADDLAKQGIRMRIYSRSTALFHPKKLVPARKIVCISAWLTYITVALMLAMVGFVTYSHGTLTPLAIIISVIILTPIIFHVRMISDPTRKPLRQLNYRLIRWVCILVIVSTALLCFGINVLFLNVKFSNTYDVVMQILTPTILSIAPLIGSIILPKVVKKYT